MKEISSLLIHEEKTIKETLKQIDEGAQKIVFVVDADNKLIGTVSDGDIRRWILGNGNLNANVKMVCTKTPLYLKQNAEQAEMQKMMLKNSINAIPLVDENKKVIDACFLNDLISDKADVTYQQIKLPVVIMAGGFGTRLEPFTRVLPKPLIPIGDKPMLEVIMDEYAKFGMDFFYVSVNHKAKMIKAYFEDSQNNYKLQYLEEDKPLGTAGALKFLEGKINTPFFVSNCDIIIKDDYSKIYDFHLKSKFDFTIIASMYNHTIPYGVCEIGEGGALGKIIEKPQYDFLVNTGMYLLNPEVLKYIPKNEFFHITHLVQKLQKKGLKVGVYPVSEKSYIDVGQWAEYRKVLKEWNY
jgi:dTDP-glucose pyrophosphorylase